MLKKSTRWQKYFKDRDPDKKHPIKEVIEAIKNAPKAKFDETIEVHFKLGIDVKMGDQQVRGTVALPHGTGKTKKIAVFCGSDKENEAKEAGADLVGNEELIKQIKQSGKIEFDLAVATPDMMKNLSQIAKILGPKGLMPSPKNETITTDIAKTVSQLKKGKIAFKNDDTANVHQIIGKRSFDTEKLAENFNALLAAIKKVKPSSSKGEYLKSVTVCSTMGPGIKVTA